MNTALTTPPPNTTLSAYDDYCDMQFAAGRPPSLTYREWAWLEVEAWKEEREEEE